MPITRRTLLAVATASILATALVPLAVSRADSLARVDVYDRSADEALTMYRQHGRRYVVGQARQRVRCSACVIVPTDGCWR